MALEIRMIQPSTGLTQKGYYGFSWTTLFFGPFPALFRSDFVTFVASVGMCVLISLITLGIGGWLTFLVWAFMYNRYYTRRLIQRGYVIADEAGRMIEAHARLGVLPTAPVNRPV